MQAIGNSSNVELQGCQLAELEGGIQRFDIYVYMCLEAMSKHILNIGTQKRQVKKDSKKTSKKPRSSSALSMPLNGLERESRSIRATLDTHCLCTALLIARCAALHCSRKTGIGHGFPPIRFCSQVCVRTHKLCRNAT